MEAEIPRVCETLAYRGHVTAGAVMLVLRSSPLQEEINVRTWDGFVRRVAAIQKTEQDLLFRGHGDSRWSLQTTLERRGQIEMPLADYFRMAGRVTPAIESLTENTFEVPPYPELKKLFSEYDGFSRALTFERFPMYEFLIYVRHHGFPAPLLDWTRSSYIAAFFAFSDDRPRVRRRSIYVWSPSNMVALGSGDPELKRCGPYVKAHHRHVLQQCDYTVCAKFVPKNREWRFAFQEEALAEDDHRVWKFNIPSSERPKVLKFLDAFNLNA